MIEDMTPAEVICHFFQSQRTDSRILHAGLPVIYCISLHFGWPLPAWLVWQNEQKICLKFAENKVSLDLKALTFVYMPCTNCSFPCSFTFSSFMWENMSTANAKSQSQFLSLNSGNSSDFPINSKNVLISPLSSHTH